MKALNLVTLALLIIGGLNWGLVGLAQYDLVAAIFGGVGTAGARIVYAIVGLCAIWQLAPFIQAANTREVPTQAGVRQRPADRTSRT